MRNVREKFTTEELWLIILLSPLMILMFCLGAIIELASMSFVNGTMLVWKLFGVE